MKLFCKVKTGFWSCLFSGAMSSLILATVPDMITSANACEDHAEVREKGKAPGKSKVAAPQAPHTRIRKDGTLEEVSIAEPDTE